MLQTLLHFAPVAAPDIGAKQKIVGDRHVAKQFAPFRHQAETTLDALLDVEARQIDPIIGYRSARAQQPGGGCQQRGLAGSVRADDGHDLAGLHCQRDAADGFDLAVGDMQILDLEQRGGHATLPR